MKTGSLVLCKVGSFPQWPAMVVPLWFLTDTVKKRAQAGKVPVCFFNDTTYYWVRPDRLVPLTAELLQERLESNTLTNVIVKGAYREASRYARDVDGFLKLKAQQEGRLKQFHRLLAEHSSTTDSSSNASTSTTESRVERPTERTVHRHVVTTKKKSLRPRPRVLDKARNVETCSLLRRRLQTNLLQRDTRPTPQEMKESFVILNKIAETVHGFFDVQALQRSKLHKVVQIIENDPQLEQFHPICKQILHFWQDLKTENH